MGEITLIHNDCMTVMAGYPDNHFDLIIADPPYFEVKGEFDFQWQSFEDYLEDVERWAKELKRVSKDSASLFWWGNSKKIAYSQIILDKYFNLENSMIWEKKDSMQYQYYSPELARCFNTHNERVLYYSCEKEMTGREFIETEYIAPRNPYALEIRTQMENKNITRKMIGLRIIGNYKNIDSSTAQASNWILGKNIPTEKDWPILVELLGIEKEYDDLRKEYDDLRKEYDDLRRPFNNHIKLTEVLKFSQQSAETSQHKHPTQKAPKLTEAIVRVAAKKGGIAFIPFVGSGTEIVACKNAGMDVVGCEINEDYYLAAVKRYYDETAQQAMF